MKTALDLLKGKKVKILTDVKVEVELTIDNVKIEHHSRQITPDTRENDWWGELINWKTYKVTFTNGYSKEYKDITDIKLL
jgi:hypothetical protein